MASSSSWRRRRATHVQTKEQKNEPSKRIACKEGAAPIDCGLSTERHKPMAHAGSHMHVHARASQKRNVERIQESNFCPKKRNDKKYATAGKFADSALVLGRPLRYRTRVYRVAGGNYTTKPPLQYDDDPGSIIYYEPYPPYYNMTRARTCLLESIADHVRVVGAMTLCLSEAVRRCWQDMLEAASRFMCMLHDGTKKGYRCVDHCTVYVTTHMRTPANDFNLRYEPLAVLASAVFSRAGPDCAPSYRGSRCSSSPPPLSAIVRLPNAFTREES